MPRWNMSHLRRFMVNHVIPVNLELSSRPWDVWLWQGPIQNPGHKHFDGVFYADGFQWPARRWIRYQYDPAGFDNDYLWIDGYYQLDEKRFHEMYDGEWTLNVNPLNMRKREYGPENRVHSSKLPHANSTARTKKGKEFKASRTPPRIPPLEYPQITDPGERMALMLMFLEGASDQDARISFDLEPPPSEQKRRTIKRKSA